MNNQNYESSMDFVSRRKGAGEQSGDEDVLREVQESDKHIPEPGSLNDIYEKYVIGAAEVLTALEEKLKQTEDEASKELLRKKIRFIQAAMEWLTQAVSQPNVPKEAGTAHEIIESAETVATENLLVLKRLQHNPLVSDALLKEAQELNDCVGFIADFNYQMGRTPVPSDYNVNQPGKALELLLAEYVN